MPVNSKRILSGALIGGLVWNAWSMVLNGLLLGQRYEQAIAAGQFQPTPRLPFMPIWIITLFVLAWIIASLYAAVRATWGPGPMTALKLGVLTGFAAGLPGNVGMACWGTFDQIFPLCWALDLGFGSVFAALIAGWMYRD
jgi:hypothetical protein